MAFQPSHRLIEWRTVPTTSDRLAGIPLFISRPFTHWTTHISRVSTTLLPEWRASLCLWVSEWVPDALKAELFTPHYDCDPSNRDGATGACGRTIIHQNQIGIMPGDWWIRGAKSTFQQSNTTWDFMLHTSQLTRGKICILDRIGMERKRERKMPSRPC